MAVPYTFANATTSIPLSQLDSNFATAITLGNTATYLGNTISTISNLTLGNVTISSGSATVTSGSIGGNVTINTTGTASTGNTSVAGALGVTATTGESASFSSNQTGSEVSLINTATASTGNYQYLNFKLKDSAGNNQLYSYITANSSTTTNGAETCTLSIGTIDAGSFYNSLQFVGRNATFNNNLSVTGALSKGSGSFRIPHPLKPETHQLVHSFIEGPQADLIYRGVVTLVNGTATINIDQAAGMTEGTFEALCRDVQCFTTNEFDWTPIRGSVSGNILSIEAKDLSCTASISWMVIGERKDKHMYDTDWTDENGKVIVEPLKPVELQQEIENDN
jgi:hypothetical protein